MTAKAPQVPSTAPQVVKANYQGSPPNHGGPPSFYCVGFHSVTVPFLLRRLTLLRIRTTFLANRRSPRSFACSSASCARLRASRRAWRNVSSLLRHHS